MHGFGEDFGEMHDTKRELSAANQSIEVHQAGHITGCEHLSSGLKMVVDTVFSHHGGDTCFGNGEGAAEATAFVFASECREADAFEWLKQLLKEAIA